MAKTKLSGVAQKLTGGMNSSDDVLAIAQDEAQLILNQHIDDAGITTTRHGSRLLNDTALDGAVTGIYDFRRPDGTGTTVILLVKAGELLYTVSTTTGVATQIADLGVKTRPTFATFQDDSAVVYAFIADGTNFIKFDGTTVTNASATQTYPWASGAPRYIQVYDDRLMASGCDTDPYKIFVSGALDGTDWMSGGVGGDEAIYWTLKSPTGDRISAISQMYDWGIIQTRSQTDIITEADPSSDTSEQLTVSRDRGTTSHWSVQSIGNNLCFADDNHIYMGELRAAIENGLNVTYIDDSISGLYQQVTNPTDIVSAYDKANKEIQWGIIKGSASRSNVTLVYNLALSGMDASGAKHVWSGYFQNTNYEPHTLSTVVLETAEKRLDGSSYTDRQPLVFRGDEDGYVYVMDETDQYKDEVGGGDDADVATEIHTALLAPYGTLRTKRLRDVSLNLYSNYDDSTTIQIKVDNRKILPVDAEGVYTSKSVDYYNVVPYWREDGDNEEKQAWGTTLWMNKPMLAKPIAFNFPFQYFQIIIKNLGANTKDEMSYSGATYTYQVYGNRRNF